MATNIEITHNDNSDTEYNVYYSSDINGEEIEITGRLVPLNTGRGDEFPPDYIFEGDPSDDENIDEEIYQQIETEIVNYFYQNQDKIK